MNDEKPKRGKEERRGDGESGGRAEPESLLERIEKTHGSNSRILLHDDGSTGAPLLRLRGKGQLDPAADDSRYLTLGELARGGVGIVYKSRDRDLGRDVAVKLLRSEYGDNAPVIERFVEEAQIGGQLQHPGVVPVYSLGLHPDGRPYFAMKMIKGETLSALLLDRESPAEKRRLYLKYFKHICQTMAYAHSRGVVHRDLKPSNVMIGAFGEVQVVDWGFAKVLGRDDTARDRPDRQSRIDVSMIATIRSGDDGSQSIAGSIMGTPAYMPPEQAMGQVDLLDERSDVFGLGAILTEILTGDPPYVGEGLYVVVMAAEARLEDAFERLDECGTDQDLIGIVKSCLSPAPQDRPANAAELLRLLVAYFSRIDERARDAELQAAEERAAVQSERRNLALRTREAAAAARSRARTLVLAGSLLLLALVAGGGLLVKAEMDRSRAERAATAVSEVLSDAARLQGEQEWAKARAAAEQAVELAEAMGAGDDRTSEARDLLESITAAERGAAAQSAVLKEDRAFAKMLENLGMEMTSDVDDVTLDQAHLAAFREHGLDLLAMSVEDAARRIRESTQSVQIANALGAWAERRRHSPALKNADWEKPAKIAQLVDPDPYRMRIRNALVSRNLRELRAIALDPAILEQGPWTLSLVGRNLGIAGDYPAGVELLREAWVKYSDDPLINTYFAQALYSVTPSSRPAAKRHLAAARVLLPESPEIGHLEGILLNSRGDLRAAIASWEGALERKPAYDHLLWHIAEAQLAEGDRTAAIGTLERAVESNPDNPWRAKDLAQLHREVGNDREALKLARRMRDEGGDNALILAVAADVLLTLGQLDEAEKAADAALALDPESLTVQRTRFSVSWNRENWSEAVSRCDEILKIRPDDSASLLNRAFAMEQDGRVEDAEKAYVHALERLPLAGRVLIAAGRHYLRQKRPEAYAELCRTWIAKYPYWATPHQELALALGTMKQWEDALRANLEGIRLERYSAYGHARLAWLQIEMQDHDAAVASALLAIDLDPKYAVGHRVHGAALRARGGKGDAPAALKAYKQAWGASHEVEDLLVVMQLHAEAGQDFLIVHELEEAIGVLPASARLRRIFAARLAAARSYDRSIVELKGALEIDAGDPETWAQLGQVYMMAGRVSEAIPAYERAIACNVSPQGERRQLLIQTYLSLATACAAQGSHLKALIQTEAAGAISTDSYLLFDLLAYRIRNAEVWDERMAAARRAAADRPRDAEARWLFGAMLGEDEQHQDALREFEAASGLAPENGKYRVFLGRALLSRGDLTQARFILEGVHEENFEEIGVAHRFLGDVLLAEGRIDDALAEYERGVRLAPNWGGAYVGLSKGQFYHGDLQEAFESASRGISLRGSWEDRLWAAHLCLLTGDLDAARSQSDFASRQAPKAPSVREVQAKVFAQSGDFAAAASVIRAAISLASDPKERSSLTAEAERYARIAAINDRWDEILDGKFVPGSAREACEVAEVAYRGEMTVLAARCFLRAEELEPGFLADAGDYPTHLAIVAASRAGDRDGLDAFDLEDAEASRYRKAAFGWLRRHCERARKALSNGAVDRLAMAEMLTILRRDENLGSVRNEGAFAAGDEAESERWKELWAEMERLQKDAAAGGGR